MTTNIPPLLPAKRPALVWVIAIFYAFGAAMTPLSYLIVYSGACPMSEEQKQYFAAQSFFDHGMTLLIVALNLAGAISLFMLRKRAFSFFLCAFSIGLLITGYQIVAKNWLSALNAAGLVGAVFGWLVAIAVIIYVKKLAMKGALR